MTIFEIHYKVEKAKNPEMAMLRVLASGFGRALELVEASGVGRDSIHTVRNTGTPVQLVEGHKA